MEKRNARCRRAYVAEALLEYLISLMVTGSFLAAILKQVGVSDAVTGIVSSLVSLTCFAQLGCGLIARPGRSTRRVILALNLIDQTMFALLYAIPFFPVSRSVKTALFVAMILGAYILLNIAAPGKYKWMMTFVHPRERGRFSARKEIVSLLGGMLFSFLMGCLVDHYREIGQEKAGFLLSGATLLLISVFHFVSLLFVEDRPQDEAVRGGGFRKTIGVLAGSRALRRLILLDILWKSAVYLSTPFYGAYLIGDLGFSLKAVSLFAVLSSTARIFVSPWFGRYADRKGWVSLLTVCVSIAAAGFFLNGFAAPRTRLLFVLYEILYALAQAGANSGMVNISYDYVSMDRFTLAMGARNGISGVVGFLVSLAGGAVVSRVQNSGLTILGFPVRAQQILSFCSCALLILCLLFLRYAIRPLPREES